MKNLKLTIDLLPKGAWGNNLSRTLSKEDWDIIRENCYKKAKHTCQICGYRTNDLDAHEVWVFDIDARTQTLKDIIALCSRCHGVKHMRNSERLGHGENAKAHFLEVNKCDLMTFANHYTEAQILFDSRNEVLRWRIKADLSKLGGNGIEIKQRYIPLIISAYEGVDWDKAKHLLKIGGHDPLIKTELGDDYNIVTLSDGEIESAYFISQSIKNFGTPKVLSIEVDNYQGIIKIEAKYTNKIQCILDSNIAKTNYSASGKFITEFKVENMQGKKIRFKLFGEGGTALTQEFRLREFS